MNKKVSAARVLDTVLLLVNGEEVARISPEEAINLGSNLEQQASLALLHTNNGDESL